MNNTTPILPRDTANKNKVETLFGPPIGVGGNPAPEWTNSWAMEHAANEKEDELTPEIVKEWIRRSKQEAGDVVPTTTLQALVNLKRPTIKLSPLHNALTDDSPQIAHTHAIEFEYDCDAARCSISVHALVSSGASTDNEQLARTVVYNHIFDGGFGNHLKLEDGAILELAKLDTNAPAITTDPKDGARPMTADTTAATTLVGSPTSAANRSMTGTSTATSLSTPATNKKRFSAAFGFRRRTMPPNAVTGPSLQVVDTDAPAPTAAEGEEAVATADKSKESDDGGVKVMIRLEALDEDDKPLPSRNAQMTYLHIVQIQSPTPTNPPQDEEAAVQSSSASQSHWVVKVVKREALLGPHVFRLQEIYGLSSSTPSQATSNTVAETTYPPTAPAPDATTECVLCLSSPREVVLLPCRHLVACRECAVNMVEFGAGGTLTHEQGETAAAGGEVTEPVAPATTGGEAAAAGATGAATTPPITATPGAPGAERRRKRKAKGWFCPVCRQPYTALLRITTTPPGKRLSEDSFQPPAGGVVAPSTPTNGDPLHATAAVVPTVAVAAPAEAHPRGGSGRFGGTLFGGLGRKIQGTAAV